MMGPYFGSGSPQIGFVKLISKSGIPEIVECFNA